MANRKSAIPFSSTPEQDQKLEEVLQELRGTQGAVMPALQKAQEIYGYLPIEVQQRVAAGLNVPLEEYMVYPPSIPSSPSIPRDSIKYRSAWVLPAM